MGLRDIGASLPPGFRFYPSDEELVCHYLYKKITNEDVLKGTLVEIDLHTCEPWQLPEVAKLNANEWYFFSFRDRKYATGFRTNRATTSGYWKATGKDRTVLEPTTREVVGMRKTLVFYRNRAPNGIKTGWIMHEFRLETPHMPPKEDWVLCRVFHKSKGEENNNKYNSPQYIFETTENSSAPFNVEVSPPLTTGNHQAPVNCGYNHHHHQQQITTTTSLSPSHQITHDQNSLLNLLQISNERNNNNITNPIISSDYGFLWDDMNLEDAAMADGGASSLENIRFEMGTTATTTNNNNMVLL